MKLFSGTPLSQFSDQPADKPGPDAKKQPARELANALAKVPSKTSPAPVAKDRAVAPEATIPEVSASSPLRIVPIPRLAAGGRWRIEAMRSLSEPLLLWFTRGQGRITVGGVTRGYGAHNAIFIPAGVMHGFEAGAQTYGTAVFFGRGCAIDLPDVPHHLRIREVGPQAELSGLIDNIQRELESGKPGAARAAQHHLGLLGVWLERHVGEDGAGGRSPTPRVALPRAIPPCWKATSAPARAWRNMPAPSVSRRLT